MHIDRQALTTCCAVGLLLLGSVGCRALYFSQDSSEIEGLDDQDLVGTSDDLAAQMADAIKSAEGAAAIQTLGTMTYSAYYDKVAALPGGPTATISGDRYQDSTAAVAAAKDTYLAQFKAYPTVADYWLAAGLDPATIDLANFLEAMRMSSDRSNNQGWFDPDMYDKGGGLDINVDDPSAVASGLNLGGLGGPRQFFDCINRLRQIRQRVTGPRSAACQLLCARNWATISDCDQLLMLGSEALSRFKPNDPKARMMTKVVRHAVAAAPHVQTFMAALPKPDSHYERSLGGAGGRDNPDAPLHTDKPGSQGDKAAQRADPKTGKGR